MLRNALEFFVGDGDPDGVGVGWRSWGCEGSESVFVAERRIGGVVIVVGNPGDFVVCLTGMGSFTRTCVRVKDDRWMRFGGDDFFWGRSFEGTQVVLGELDVVKQRVGLFVGDEALSLGAIDVVEGELDVVRVGERWRLVVAIARQEKALVHASVVVAIVVVVHAGRDAGLAGAQNVLALVGHSFLHNGDGYKSKSADEASALQVPIGVQWNQ
jgi:hypothetical protein